MSRLLVKGLARAGRGTAEFVDGTTDHAVFDAVGRQMEVATAGALDDLSVAWGAAGAPEEEWYGLAQYQNLIKTGRTGRASNTLVKFVSI